MTQQLLLQKGIPVDIPPPCPTGETAGNGSTYLRCQYLLVHKRYRQCKMTRRATDPYCATHMDQFLTTEPNNGDKKRKADVMMAGKKHSNDYRIPCPIDSRHTVWRSDLNGHVKKCPALVKATHYKSQPWYSENACLLDSTSSSNEKPADITGQEFKDISARLKEWFTHDNNHELPVIDKKILSHSGLDCRLSQLGNKKHALQQSSIVGHLQRIGLLDSDATYVELGCGRAELSRYVNQCLLLQKPKIQPCINRFLLIDRDGARMKFDGKIISDTEDAELPIPKVLRVRVDIKDLSLGPALNQLQSPTTSPVVCISKHLCGAATDLSIQCIANYVKFQPHHTVTGIIIALCCRHRCSWEAYPLRGRQLLGSICNITDKRQFYVLSKMSSWAVCGRRSHQTEDDITHISGYTVNEREILGRYARQLIDYGRVVALREAGFNVDLFEYVDPSVSLENTLLVALPKNVNKAG